MLSRKGSLSLYFFFFFRTLASVNGVQWTEYWEFLDAFVNLDSIEGLNMLETFLKNKIESVSLLLSNNNCKPIHMNLVF